MLIILLLNLVCGAWALPTEDVSCGPALVDSTSPEELTRMRDLQRGKNRIRDLELYDRYIVRWATGPNRELFLDMVATAAGRTVAKPTLLKLLASYDRTLAWSDVGAGFAIPFRELRRDQPALAAKLRLTAVDLFDWAEDGDSPERTQILESNGGDLFDPAHAPKLSLGDMGVVTPEHQDLITSIESFQYIKNKVEMIAALYNKLAPHGLLIIATTHYWAQEMVYDLKPQPEGRAVLSDILLELHREGIRFAAFGESSSKIRTLVLQRTPGTRLVAHSHPARFERLLYGSELSFYPDRTGLITVERD